MSEAAGGGGGADTELKTKTPHVNVGKKSVTPAHAESSLGGHAGHCPSHALPSSAWFQWMEKVKAAYLLQLQHGSWLY